MMKKIFLLLLSISLILSGCSSKNSDIKNDDSEDTTSTVINKNISDTSFLQYIQDDIYAATEASFETENYTLENVQVVYVSDELLEETEFNSKKNIYFGFDLQELKEYFQDSKFVFAVDDEGNTTVKKFEEYDDTYDQVAKNVMIGTGVILVCATVSVVSGAAGLATVSVIFAASAKTATEFAIGGAVFSGAINGAVKYYQTGSLDDAKKAAALSASSSFKWGAISGAVIGGAKSYLDLSTTGIGETTESASSIPDASESEEYAKEVFGGSEQKSYLNGKEVAYGEANSTRPDLVRKIGNKLEAIEVKNYDLENNYSNLITTLKSQITNRVENMPEGTLQRIALDVRGRGYSEEFLETAIEGIQDALQDIYPNIPIEIMG